MSSGFLKLMDEIEAREDDETIFFDDAISDDECEDDSHSDDEE